MVFFFKKKYNNKNKNYHVNKNSQKLFLDCPMYQIANAICMKTSNPFVIAVISSSNLKLDQNLNPTLRASGSSLLPPPNSLPFSESLMRSEALVPIELVADSLSQLATITRQASNNVLYRASTSQNPPRFVFTPALSH
jgi:hypothetical protein